MRDKPTFYCKRCRRQLRSRLCSLHGTDFTIELSAVRPTANTAAKPGATVAGNGAVPLPPPGGFFAPAVMESVPAAAPKAATAPASAPQRAATQPAPRPSAPPRPQAPAATPVAQPRPNGAAPRATAPPETPRPRASRPPQANATARPTSTAAPSRPKAEKPAATTAPPVDRPVYRPSQAGIRGRRSDNSLGWMIDESLAGHAGQRPAEPAPPTVDVTVIRQAAERSAPASESTTQRQRRFSRKSRSAERRRPVTAEAAPPRPPHTGRRLLIGLGGTAAAAIALLYAWILTAIYAPEWHPEALLAQLTSPAPQVNERLTMSSTTARDEAAPVAIDPVEVLVSKARAALAQKAVTTPEGANALAYLLEARTLSPAHPALTALEGELVDDRLRLGARAQAAERYGSALDYYRTAQRVRPDDPDIAERIDDVLRLQAARQELATLREIEDAQREIKELRKAKYKLKAELRTEERRRSDGEDDPAAPSSASTVASAAVVDAAAGDADDLGIELLDPVPATAEAAADRKEATPQGPPLVFETDIDGRKQYDHVPTPAVPAHLKSDGLVMVMAECQVDVDGRVQSVKVVSPAERQEFNALAVEAFRKYRFQPATFKGKPVRFTAVEVISF